MVKCPTDGMTIKSRDSNNQRIAALEEKVAEQARTITSLQQQLQTLSTFLASAAQCIATSSDVSSNTEINNGSNTDNSEREDALEEEAATSTQAKKEPSPPQVQYNYKNLLQEHVVKQGWTLPNYVTNKVPGGFSSVITLNDQTYTSKVAKSKVLAEKSAACILLQALSVIDENGIPVADGDPKRNAGVSKYSWCKNQLQEYFAKRGLKYPSYSLTQNGGKGFTAEVSHDKFPEKVLGPLACSKRIAEQMAAHKAITVWKIAEDSSDS